VSLESWIRSALGASVPIPDDNAGAPAAVRIETDVAKICEDYAKAVVQGDADAKAFPKRLRDALEAGGTDEGLGSMIENAACRHFASLSEKSPHQGLGAVDEEEYANPLEGTECEREWRQLARAIKIYAGEEALGADGESALDLVRQYARDLASAAKPQYETIASVAQTPLGGFASAQLDDGDFERVLESHGDSCVDLDEEIFDALYEAGDMQLFEYTEPADDGEEYTEYYGVFTVPAEDGTFEGSTVRRRPKRKMPKRSGGRKGVSKRIHSLPGKLKKKGGQIMDRLRKAGANAKEKLREVRQTAFQEPEVGAEPEQLLAHHGGEHYADEEEESYDARSFAEKLQFGAAASSPVSKMTPSDRASLVYSYSRFLSLSEDPREARAMLATRDGLRAAASEMEAAVAALDASKATARQGSFQSSLLDVGRVMNADEQTFVRVATARHALSRLADHADEVDEDELGLVADLAYASLDGPRDILNKARALVGRGLSSALVAFCRDTAKEMTTGDFDRYAAEQGSALGAELLQKLTSDSKRNVFERVAYVVILSVGLARSLSFRGLRLTTEMFPTLHAVYGSKGLKSPLRGYGALGATISQKLFGIRQRVLDEILSRSLKYAGLPGDSKTASSNKRVQATGEVSKLAEKTKEALKAGSRELTVLLAVAYGIMDAALSSSSSEDVKYYFLDGYFGSGSR
jgi:hypothetical protein